MKVLYYTAIVLWAIYCMCDFEFLKKPRLTLTVNGNELTKGFTETLIYVIGVLFILLLFKDPIGAFFVVAVLLIITLASKKQSRYR